MERSRCNGCKVDKDVSEFTPSALKYGIRACKSCLREKRRREYLKARETRHLLKKSAAKLRNFTVEELIAMTCKLVQRVADGETTSTAALEYDTKEPVLVPAAVSQPTAVS